MMRAVVILGIALLLAGGAAASAARPAIPPGCLKHPSIPGCLKYFPRPSAPAGAVSVPPTLPAINQGDVRVVVSDAVSQAIAKQTPLKPVVTAPRGRISVTAHIIAVRTAYNVGQVGGVRSTYMQLWNRALSTRPIGYAIVTCFSIGTGGILGKLTPEECHGYYAMPRGKIITAGVAFLRRSYWLAVLAGTGLYAHGAGWAHYDHGKLIITLQ